MCYIFTYIQIADAIKLMQIPQHTHNTSTLTRLLTQIGSGNYPGV